MKKCYAKDPTMTVYRTAVRWLKGHFGGLELHHVHRTDNEAADSLTRICSTYQKIPPGIFLQQLHQPSIKMESEPESSEPESQGSNIAESAQKGVLAIIQLDPAVPRLPREEGAPQG